MTPVRRTFCFPWLALVLVIVGAYLIHRRGYDQHSVVVEKPSYGNNRCWRGP